MDIVRQNLCRLYLRLQSPILRLPQSQGRFRAVLKPLISIIFYRPEQLSPRPRCEHGFPAVMTLQFVSL